MAKHSGDRLRQAKARQQKEKERVAAVATLPVAERWDRCPECGRVCEVNEVAPAESPNGALALILWCDHCEAHSPLIAATYGDDGRLIPVGLQ